MTAAVSRQPPLPAALVAASAVAFLAVFASFALLNKYI